MLQPTGELKFSWGSPGHGPGQFDTVHSIFIDHDDGDRLYVADRFNNRIQFLRLDGAYLGEWGGLRLPQSVRKGPDGSFFVAELSHRITVLDATGAVVSRWGDDVAVDDADGGTAAALPDAPSRKETIKGRVRNDPGPGLFCAPHGIAVNSQGSFYVGEASESWRRLDRGSRSVQKFVRK